MRCCMCNKSTEDNDKSNNDNISYFRFPRDGKLLSLWVEAVRKVHPKFMLRQTHRICCRHFGFYLGHGKLKRLPLNAVPTLNPIIHPEDPELNDIFVDEDELYNTAPEAPETDVPPSDLDLLVEEDLKHKLQSESAAQSNRRRKVFPYDFSERDMVDEELAIRYYRASRKALATLSREVWYLKRMNKRLLGKAEPSNEEHDEFTIDLDFELPYKKIEKPKINRAINNGTHSALKFPQMDIEKPVEINDTSCDDYYPANKEPPSKKIRTASSRKQTLRTRPEMSPVDPYFEITVQEPQTLQMPCLNTEKPDENDSPDNIDVNHHDPLLPYIKTEEPLDIVDNTCPAGIEKLKTSLLRRAASTLARTLNAVDPFAEPIVHDPVNWLPSVKTE